MIQERTTEEEREQQGGRLKYCEYTTSLYYIYEKETGGREAQLRGRVQRRCRTGRSELNRELPRSEELSRTSLSVSGRGSEEFERALLSREVSTSSKGRDPHRTFELNLLSLLLLLLFSSLFLTVTDLSHSTSSQSQLHAGEPSSESWQEPSHLLVQRRSASALPSFLLPLPLPPAFVLDPLADPSSILIRSRMLVFRWFDDGDRSLQDGSFQSWRFDAARLGRMGGVRWSCFRYASFASFLNQKLAEGNTKQRWVDV